MKKINVARVLLGGILAGVLMFMADGFIHSKLLHEHWMAAMKAAGRSVEAEKHGSRHALLRGLRAAARPGRGRVVLRLPNALRPGAQDRRLCRAVPVGGDVPDLLLQEVPLGFYSTTLLALWSLYELVPSVIAGLVAGALYKDSAA
jgi:hypothetical protein